MTALTSTDLVGAIHTISLGASNVGGPLNLVTGAITAQTGSLLSGVAAGRVVAQDPGRHVATGASLAGGGSY